MMDTDKFWNGFAKKSWEKKPILVKDFKSSIVQVDQAEIFSMLVEFSNRCRKLKSSDGFKLYIDSHLSHPEETLQFLPVKEDKSLQGYHARMEQYYSDYCLVCDELLQVSHKNWKRLQEFTSTLFSHVGFPNRFIEMGLYLGNYRKTPFGVHVDGCGVFSFPVVGDKTFRLWTPAFAKANPSLDRSLSYSKFKKSSEIMKASPGDMAYWPSSAWHIAESNGQFSATWSLGVWVDQPHRDKVSSALKPLLDVKLGAAGEDATIFDGKPSDDGEVKSLPTNYLRSIERIKNISADELDDAFMNQWLQLNSLQGFKTPPKSAASVKITLNSKLEIGNSTRILWAKLKSNKIVYAYAGLIAETSSSIELKKLIDALNKGKICKISDYLKGAKRLENLNTLRSLLQARK